MSVVEDKFLRSGIRLFMFIMKEPFRPTPEEAEFVLPEITTVTGGEVVEIVMGEVPDPRVVIRNLLSRVYDEMQHYYLLNLTISQPWPKRARLHLDVVDDRGKRRKGLAVLYQQFLLSCQP